MDIPSVQALVVFMFLQGSLQLGLGFETLYCFILLLSHPNMFYLYLVHSGESREGKKCTELRGKGEAEGWAGVRSPCISPWLTSHPLCGSGAVTAAPAVGA